MTEPTCLPTCLHMLQAANYLNIKGLLDLTCSTVAQMIKGKTPEEIRKTFNIKVDCLMTFGTTKPHVFEFF